MRLINGLILLTVLCGADAKANEPRNISTAFTAEELYTWCLATKRKTQTLEQRSDAARCLGFLEGVVKGIKWSEYAAKTIFGEMSIAARQGGDKIMADTFSGLAKGSEIPSEALLACMPLEIEVQQVADAYIDYIQGRPSQLVEKWYTALPAAIARQYSCKSKPK